MITLTWQGHKNARDLLPTQPSGDKKQQQQQKKQKNKTTTTKQKNNKKNNPNWLV